MSALAMDLTKATRDGGNAAVIVQLKDNGDGTYVDATAVDVFGEPAGTAHYLGNFTDSQAVRQADGSWKFDFSGMEQDLVRLNMLELLAPISAADNSSDQLIMEDNVSYVGSKNNSYDSGKPVFAIWYFQKKLGGKTRCRHAIIQFNPDGGPQGQKAKTWNQWKISAYSIDAGASPAVTQPSDTLFTTPAITTPALAAPYQFGKELESA